MGILDLTFHDLRRTYVTRLVRAGVPLPTVQAMAGHASIETTLTYRNAVNKDDQRRAEELLEAASAV